MDFPHPPVYQIPFKDIVDLQDNNGLQHQNNKDLRIVEMSYQPL